MTSPAGNHRSGIVDAFCRNCDLDRSTDASVTNTIRTPCPRCGETALNFKRHLTRTATVSAHVSTALRPGRQDRDWRVRWEQLEARLPNVVTPRSEARSAAAIHSATQGLLQFFISAYHLKDALIEDGAVSRRTVENAIGRSHVLALLTDLANLDKHRRLTRGTKSGDVPVLESVSDVSDGPRWRLVVTIRHQGRTIDGTTFATTAIDEWRTLLERWRLI